MEDAMTKQQFKNLWRSYRYMKRYCTIVETLAWIGFYNIEDRKVIEKVIN